MILDMKNDVVILAGGYGTRLSEYTYDIPKPMIKISKWPILFHIMIKYSKYNFTNFIVAGGYKYKRINNYFSKVGKILNKTTSLNEYSIPVNLPNFKTCLNVKIVNTGLKTMTGGRLKRLSKYINSETFMMTYGDGLSDVNLKKLLNKHHRMNTIATVTAVRPPARFGYLNINKNLVTKFTEKKQTDEGWINGGFFVFNKKIFEYIKDDNTFLEKEPLSKLAKKSELAVYEHKSFWACIDTKRDLDNIKSVYSKLKYNSPWLN